MNYVVGFFIQILVLGTLVAVGLFVHANPHEINLVMPILKSSILLPVWVAVLGAFAFGFIIAFAGSRVGVIWLKFSLNRTKKKLEEQENSASLTTK